MVPNDKPQASPFRQHQRADARALAPLPQAVTASYASHGNYALAALFTSISVLSLFADSVAPKNKLVNSLDRVVASLGFIFSPVRPRSTPFCGGGGCAAVRYLTKFVLNKVVLLSTVAAALGYDRARRGVAASPRDGLGAPSAARVPLAAPVLPPVSLLDLLGEPRLTCRHNCAARSCLR